MKTNKFTLKEVNQPLVAALQGGGSGSTDGSEAPAKKMDPSDSVKVLTTMRKSVLTNKQSSRVAELVKHI